MADAAPMSGGSNVGGEAPNAGAAIASDVEELPHSKGSIRAKAGGKPTGAPPAADAKSRIVSQDMPGMRSKAASASSDAESAPETNPLEALLQSIVGDEPGRQEEVEPEELEGLEKESDAAKRIQKLISQRKEIEAKAKQDHDLAWQQHQRMQQMERQFGQFATNMQRENAMLKARLETLTSMSEQQRLRDNPEAQLENDWLKKQEQLFEQKLNPYAQRIEQLQRQLQERDHQERLNGVKSKHSAEMDAALKEVILSSVPEGYLDEADVGNVKRWAYAIAMDAAARKQPLSLKDAVLNMKKTAAKLSLGLLRHGQKAGAKAKQENGNAASVVRDSNNAARGNAEPDIRTLRFNGYKDLPEWMMSGRKSLRTPPADYDW